MPMASDPGRCRSTYHFVRATGHRLCLWLQCGAHAWMLRARAGGSVALAKNVARRTIKKRTGKETKEGTLVL